MIINNKKLVRGIVFIDKIEMMGELSTRINQYIKFIDITTWKVYEHYTINREIKINQLGFFSSVYQYRPIIKSTFLERRGNFQGYKMKAMTEEIGPYVYFDLCVDHVISTGSQLTNLASFFFLFDFFLSERSPNRLKLSLLSNAPL